MKSYASSKTIIMEVVWSPLSLLRYEEIKIYLLENFGKDSSNEFSDKLLSSVDLIAQNSAVGKKYTTIYAHSLLLCRFQFTIK